MVSLLASCELEMSHNGDLDGMWLLQSIDTLATEGIADVRGEQITWSFQGRLLQVRNQMDGRQLGVYFSFRHDGDSLLLSNPYHSDREVDDIQVENPDELEFYGIHELSPRYRVLELNGGHMRLKGANYRLHFKKY